MAARLSGILALVVFAICLIVGIQTGNPFTTTVWRALLAMFGTYVIGMVVGLMAQRMLDESVKGQLEKPEKLANEAKSNDR